MVRHFHFGFLNSSAYLYLLNTLTKFRYIQKINHSQIVLGVFSHNVYIVVDIMFNIPWEIKLFMAIHSVGMFAIALPNFDPHINTKWTYTITLN